MPQNRTRLGIVRITPSLLDRGQVWFTHNIANIRSEAKNPISWWAGNFKEIEVDEVVRLSEFLRLLHEWGYQRVSTVRAPGEVAVRGGIVDLFPINEPYAWRIELAGNTVASLTHLTQVTTPTETPIAKTLTRGPEAKTPKEEKTKKEYEEMLASLTEGSYVVHVDHGIARFKGIEEGYLVLEYAAGDVLRVPTATIGRISPYVGFTQPTLTRLGGNLWEKTKRKVKEDLLKTAEELVRIYANRELAHKDGYEIDEGLEKAIEASFAFEETPDQKGAIEAVRADLSSPTPMDRVICADVGFGKTEVALRAAAFAVGAGRQVALVAPTTILAHQHYQTFVERFAGTGYPVRIAKLTRIESAAVQRDIIAGAHNKSIDIIIGTHRLLQKDVNFANLGLLIVDEEQRFGVKQKEVLKAARASLDVLSLSATPIPRTLSFALSGIRDLSLISTPPLGRKPVTTIIKQFDEELVRTAIGKELARGGQVYYLHNRILSLGRTVQLIQRLATGARIEFLHAKLPEDEIIRRIDAFGQGATDVLISTTIMENGLDLANANTLIVEDATKLGLAQAHQIRGRVGRGRTQAFAYFLYPNRKLAPKAQERLAALESSQSLGAGYEIALRDLEIRGAGNFLGREQSGHIARVGFNLYCQLLNEAIMEIKDARKHPGT